MNMPNAGTKDDPSSKPIYATATCNFLLLDVSNMDSFSVIHDLKLLNNEMKAIKKESESAEKLSDQLAEVQSMISELSALTKKTCY